MGTVHLLEAVRQASTVRAVLCITSDKCYENREWLWGYRENEAMGGFDAYSSSKGCAELVIAAYRQSFFQAGVSVASARAGNVIGGGDWARDRLVPDMMQSFMRAERPLIRFPAAVRPWQHVLEPLRGYLMLAEKLWHGDKTYAEGWNFGPADSDARPVQWLADRLAALWGGGAGWDTVSAENPHEAHYLKLDCAKAHARLGWQPALILDDALAGIVEWHKALERGSDMAEVTRRQILQYARHCGMIMPHHEKVL
jgi:CDP-glucose 4,6-dehydratase